MVYYIIKKSFILSTINSSYSLYILYMDKIKPFIIIKKTIYLILLDIFFIWLIMPFILMDYNLYDMEEDGHYVG